MTVTAQTPYNTSIAAPGATVFPYGFKILAAGDLRVLVDGVVKTLGVDFTISGVGQDGGGNITFVTPLTGGQRVLRKSAMAYERTTDYQNLGDLHSATLNNDQDSPVLMIRQLAAALGLSIQIPEIYQGIFSAQLPVPAPLAPLVFNAGGTAIEAGSTTLTGDMLLRPNLADGGDPDKGAALVAFRQPGDGPLTRTVMDKLWDTVSVTDFGASADSNGLIGSGTDNTAAFQAAIIYALSSGKSRIYIPAGAGYYRFDVASEPLDPGVGNLTFFGDGMNSSRLLFEEGANTGSDRKTLFSNTTTNLKGALEFQSIGFFGTLTQKGFVEGGGAALFLDYYASINVHDCKFYDLSFMATACEAIRQVWFKNNHCERIVRDSCRFRSSFNCIVTGNVFKHTADDSVALHQANYVTGAGNIRDSIIVTDNIFEDANGIRIWGARKATVSNNILNRCKVDPISILGDSLEGDNPMFHIEVHDNKIYDPLAAPPFSSALQVVIGINSLGRKGGSQTGGIVPGENNVSTGSFVLPYAYLSNNITAGSVTSAPALFGVTVRNNVIARTLPAVSNYSDWGFGQAFSETGFVNPAVTDAALRPLQGVNVDGNARRLMFSENNFSNLTQGIAIGASGNSFGMESMLISDNTFYDVLDSGVYFTGPAAARTVDVKISRNNFNLDPFHLSGNRAAAKDGTWQADAAPFAMGGNGYQSIVFEGNVLSNLGKVSSNLFDISTIYRSNVARCNPVQVGFSTSNAGIGNVPGGGLGQGWTHAIVDYNPKSANYLNQVNETLATSFGLPSSGKYVQGHFVQNVDYALAIAGYVRLNTGTGHTGGTDWKAVTLA